MAMSTKQELEEEVERLLGSLPEKVGLRAVLLAYFEAECGIPVNQVCLWCNQSLQVTPYPDGFQQGGSVRCPCGKSNDEFKGL